MTGPPPLPLEAGTIIPLAELGVVDAGRVGGKAANLGELMRLGFRVPDGFAVLGEPSARFESALKNLGVGPFAVRSSALAEDLAEASFAGQYETYLNVTGPSAVRDAMRGCRESAASSRVASYRGQRGIDSSTTIAVLVQQMVQPTSAGVAFTANPVTGDRSEAVISAVRGLGESLVSGEGKAEEWLVIGRHPARRRGVESVITSEQAMAITDLARRSAQHFGVDQDVEWAIAEGEIYLLQSRPMTALPEPVTWSPPGAGYWMRNLRLGEWLPEPVTPLFEDWLVKALNAGFARGNAIDVGLGAGLNQATVNGWYYSTPQPDLKPAAVARALVTRPRTLWRFATSLIRQSTNPELSEKRYFARVVRRWRSEALPRYRALVDRRATEVETAQLDRLPSMVDEVGLEAGEQLWCLAIGGGSAWKVEVALARFFRQYLATKVTVDLVALLVGLSPDIDHSAPHLVQSADWVRPTLGEAGASPSSRLSAERRGQLDDSRREAEKACREVLAGDPELLQRFEGLLSLAQQYSRLREEQAASLTLGWPVLRRCVLRLGSQAVEHSAIDTSDDSFFLTRAELEAATKGMGAADLRDRVGERRSEWERRRRLGPPLALGEAPKLLQRMLATLELLRSDAVARDGSLHGEPASPGKASGPVRVVRGPEDFEAFREGEVLVAQATAPAWTPLFALAAAVVTDGGSLAAHASLVAREYGIPAVVATGDATARLADGQWVTVDGSGGFVEFLR